MPRSMILLKAVRLVIYPEIMEDEIVHNHFDCPSCGVKYSPSEQYEEIKFGIECRECHARFITDHDWIDENASWRQIQ